MKPDAYDEAAGLVVGLGQAGMSIAVMAGVLSQAVEARPENVGARAALAGCLWETGDRDAAIAHMRLVVQRNPDPTFGHALAAMFACHGAGEEAATVLRHLRQWTPANANFFAARGRMLLRLASTVGDQDGRVAAFALTMTAQRDRMTEAETFLRHGDMDAGLEAFAWRLRDPSLPGISSRLDHGPLERPDPVDWRGRTVLCYGELGHGDMIQCLRFIPMVLEAGAEVVLELQPGLVRLARSVAGVRDVVAWGEAVPPHDVALPLFHLPWAFRIGLDRIPASIPYVAADRQRIAAWRARLQAFPGLKVGLVWAGEPRLGTVGHAMDLVRSMPLAALAPLGAVPGVVLVSLQKGAGAAQTVMPPAGLAMHDWTAELGDFSETAALMEALDLVVSVDTACVHLAGALGRPVWLLNRFGSCWRWLRDRDDSPWYPTLRQFRQASPGDWGGVVARVAEELGKLARGA